MSRCATLGACSP